MHILSRLVLVTQFETYFDITTSKAIVVHSITYITGLTVVYYGTHFWHGGTIFFGITDQPFLAYWCAELMSDFTFIGD